MFTIIHEDGRPRIAYVGENGVEPGTLYRLDENRQSVKA
jgi:hypothetical protein